MRRLAEANARLKSQNLGFKLQGKLWQFIAEVVVLKDKAFELQLRTPNSET